MKYILNCQILGRTEDKTIFQMYDTVSSNIRFKIDNNIYSFELLSSKMFYNIFIGTIQDVFVSKHAEVDNTEVAICFLNPRICTLDGKLREFPYKLLHNLIFCSDKLNQFGLVQSNLCSFCEKEIETYSHIFFKCSEVINIMEGVWESIKTFSVT